MELECSFIKVKEDVIGELLFKIWEVIEGIGYFLKNWGYKN